MKRLLNTIPILRIYVDIEPVSTTYQKTAASSGINFDSLEIFPENMSISRRYKRASTWITPVVSLIRSVLKSMNTRKFNLIKFYPSKKSYTYYIKFQPTDKSGSIINKELMLQFEIREHDSSTHTEGKISDNFRVKAYMIEDTEYPDVLAIRDAIDQVMDRLQQGDFSDFDGE